MRYFHIRLSLLGSLYSSSSFVHSVDIEAVHRVPFKRHQNFTFCCQHKPQHFFPHFTSTTVTLVPFFLSSLLLRPPEHPLNIRTLLSPSSSTFLFLACQLTYFCFSCSIPIRIKRSPYPSFLSIHSTLTSSPIFAPPHPQQWPDDPAACLCRRSRPVSALTPAPFSDSGELHPLTLRSAYFGADNNADDDDGEDYLDAAEASVQRVFLPHDPLSIQPIALLIPKIKTLTRSPG